MGRALIDPMGWLPLPVADPDPGDAAKRLAVAQVGPGLRARRLGTALREVTLDSVERSAVFALAFVDERRAELLAIGQCLTAWPARFELGADPGPAPGSAPVPPAEVEAAALRRRMAGTADFRDAELSLFETAAGVGVRSSGRWKPGVRWQDEAVVQYLVPRPEIGTGILLQLVFCWERGILTPMFTEMADERAATFVLVPDA